MDKSAGNQPYKWLYPYDIELKLPLTNTVLYPCGKKVSYVSTK
jgi:hypothetical protein